MSAKTLLKRFLLFILKSAFLPLVLFWETLNPAYLFRNKKVKFPGFIPFVKKTISLIFIIPLLFMWIFTYYTAGVLVASQLGYISYTENIVGTGSMYPTWPKGTKGKDAKELSKEIVSTAGFFPYPNGIFFRGKNYFGHTIARGDIVTAENEKIREITEKTYGTEAGVLKRVIAVGGDTLELRDGILYLNGEPQKEPYIAKPRSTFGEGFLNECQKYEVPEDSVFLMGDNRKGSGDSREFGAVKYSEINAVLPLKKQIGTLDKNWHDPSDDLADTARPTINTQKFVELLNIKRKEKGLSNIKYEQKLDLSTEIRGKYLLGKNLTHEEASYETLSSAMEKAGYWNSYLWEWSFAGYYDAEELIEDYIERDSTDSKDVWFDEKFDDIGIAEIRGQINGCPTQLIIIHAAGYVPPNYNKDDIAGWQSALDKLKEIKPGWESLKNTGDFYERNRADIDRMNQIIDIRISRIGIIVSKMNENKWLSKEEERWTYEDEKLYLEQEALATKLNNSQ
jgi:signal peptidase I